MIKCNNHISAFDKSHTGRDIGYNIPKLYRRYSKKNNALIDCMKLDKESDDELLNLLTSDK